MSDTGIAKIFMHGRSQAVCLPLAFRLPGDRVRVRRVASGILLEPMVIDIDAWFAALDRFADSLHGRWTPTAADARNQGPVCVNYFLDTFRVTLLVSSKTVERRRCGKIEAAFQARLTVLGATDDAPCACLPKNVTRIRRPYLAPAREVNGIVFLHIIKKSFGADLPIKLPP
jgi:antitoxin VapB